MYYLSRMALNGRRRHTALRLNLVFITMMKHKTHGHYGGWNGTNIGLPYG